MVGAWGASLFASASDRAPGFKASYNLIKRRTVDSSPRMSYHFFIPPVCAGLPARLISGWLRWVIVEVSGFMICRDLLMVCASEVSTSDPLLVTSHLHIVCVDL